MPRPWLALAIVCGVVLAAMLIFTAAVGQTINPCVQDGLQRFERGLWANYGEHKIAEAVTRGGERLLIYVSDSGTWTMIAVNAEGVACLLTSGDGYTFIRGAGEAS